MCGVFIETVDKSRGYFRHFYKDFFWEKSTKTIFFKKNHGMELFIAFFFIKDFIEELKFSISQNYQLSYSSISQTPWICRLSQSDTLHGTSHQN